MNIKSVTGPTLPQEIKKIERRAQDSSADRDAQSEGGDGQQERRKLSEEEIKQAIEILKNVQGIKDNNLVIRLDHHDDTFTVYVEDYHGKVIRRLSETDLWHLTREKDKSKGNLFDRAM